MNKRLLYGFTFGVIAAASTFTAAQTNSAPATQGRSVCVPYDPLGLKIEQSGKGTDWRLIRADGAIFKVFADREDALAGLAVALEHTQLCYIGKSNTRTNRQDYIMEYWK